MSWLWGGYKQPLPESFSDFVPPPAAGGALGGAAGGGDDGKNPAAKSGAMEPFQFDCTALERAAETAKSLEKHPNPSEHIWKLKEQEQKEAEELEGGATQMEGELSRVRQEERGKLTKEHINLDKEKVNHSDKLARKRQEEQMELHQRLHDESLRRNEISTAKLEKMRQETVDYEIEREAQMKMRCLEKKVLCQGKTARENHDLTLEKIRLEAKEARKTSGENIASIGSLVGSGLQTFLGDQQRLTNAVGGVVAITVGYLAAKGSLGIAFRFLEARLVKPSLVRETSRLSLMETLKHPIDTVHKIRWRIRGSEDALKGVILTPNVEAAIRNITLETRNCRKAKGTYRNVLLHGPPGTGKTLFAKKLALNSGMDYAIMTGGDVQVMGDKSVDAIHKLFDWSKTSRRGLILFIDEAESFLISRHNNISQHMRDTMAAFLSHTGNHNDRFMMVLTTNIPTVFDKAVVNRIHEAVEFGLPGLRERTQLVGHYFEEYILKPASTGKWRIKLDEANWSEVCKEIAEMTEGLSGREIAHLALDWQMKTIVTEKGELTKELMLERAESAMERKKTTLLWEQAHQEQNSKFSSLLVDKIKSDAAAAALKQTGGSASPIPSTS